MSWLRSGSVPDARDAHFRSIRVARRGVIGSGSRPGRARASRPRSRSAQSRARKSRCRGVPITCPLRLGRDAAGRRGWIATSSRFARVCVPDLRPRVRNVLIGILFDRHVDQGCPLLQIRILVVRTRSAGSDALVGDGATHARRVMVAHRSRRPAGCARSALVAGSATEPRCAWRSRDFFRIARPSPPSSNARRDAAGTAHSDPARRRDLPHPADGGSVADGPRSRRRGRAALPSPMIIASTRGGRHGRRVPQGAWSP